MNQSLFFNKKIVAAVLSGFFAVSFIYGLPHILVRNKLAVEGFRYVPITAFSDGDEAQIYAPLISEVARGKAAVGDPALKEHGNDFSLLPPLGPLFLGFMARIAGAEQIWILADFLFPPLIFLIFFFIVYELSGSVYFSLAASGIFIFTREIASLIPFSIFNQFKQFAVYFKPYITSAVENRLPFDRLLAPEWTFIPLGLFFLLWVISLKRKTFLSSAACGIIFGLLFYSYPFDWISVSVILAVSFLLSLAARDYEIAKKTCLVLFSGFIVAVPYWISFWGIRHYPQYGEIMARTGLEIGRTFRFLLLPHYVLWIGLAVWLFFKRKENYFALPAAAIFISAFFVMNLQLLAGYVPQPDHFLRYPFAFALSVAYIIFGLILWRRYSLFEEYGWILRAAAIIAVVLVLGRAVQLQIAYANENSWRYKLDKSVDESFAWMRTNVKKDSVVLSPSVITNAHLLIFTPAKVFVPSTGAVTSASNEELTERFIIAAKIFGASDERIKTLFSRNFLESKSVNGEAKSAEDMAAVHLYHYGLYGQEPGAAFKEKKFRSFGDVDAAVSRALGEWRNNRKALLKKYELNYIYAGPDEENKFNFSAKEFGRCLNKIYENTEVKIYQVNSCFLNL